MSQPQLEKTERTRLRRLREKGSYDRDTVNAILDAMPLAHLGYQIDGKPSVLPTLQWREGDHVYWHGSSASRALRAMKGNEVCLTVTIMDGFALARSAMHHSVNHRSVMLFGVAEQVSDPEQKAVHLERMVESLFPGRWRTLRPMTDQEVKATAVFRMPIAEGSAKTRNAQPADDEEDYALPIWAGIVPMHLHLGDPISDPANPEGVEMPEHLTAISMG